MKFLLILPLFCGAVLADDAAKGKSLPVFQVVRFPNDPCTVTAGSKNGTCYTAEECSNKGGVNAGSCAEGFGVCCTFTLGCGSSTTENCTYFETTTIPTSGSCAAKVCKLNSNICQIRLDFQSFQITGPSTSTVTVTLAIGSHAAIAGKKVADRTQCLTDTFQVTNQVTLPVICGTNDGAHVYFDASDNCNDLVMNLGTSGIGVTAIATRKFNIKVTQYSCDYNNLAPSGCDQWFFGAGGAGTVKSFNFDGGLHLADQKQSICVRRETGNCRICWTAAAADDVNIAGNANQGKVTGSECCAYGAAGIVMDGFDCLMIPGASKKTGFEPTPVSMCAGGAGLITAMGVTSKTVCSKILPFRIDFYSDTWEWAETIVEATAGKSKGFKVNYAQTAC